MNQLKYNWNRKFRQTVNGIFTLAAIFVVFTGPALAGQKNGYPKPSKGTDADFYVSWDDGSDSNPGTFEMPFKTPGKAIDMLKAMQDPSGKIVLIRGGWYSLKDNSGNRVNLKNLHGSIEAPIQIRGYPGETVMLDSFIEDFDPLAYPCVMECGWGGISINESSHILVENFQVQGRCLTNVELMNSNHIQVRFIEAFRSNQHGLFTGGSFHDLTIEACKFYENIYGSSASHGVYISGGIWDPELPPVRNIIIRYVESYYNGRHGIQVNGRVENVSIENCNMHHNILGGLSLIGARNMRITDNLMYKNNKQGIILYTYFDDAYWDPDDPESVADWKKTHWTIENVEIFNNTIFMDDVPWYDDQWVSYNPEWHAGIILAETSGLLPPYDNIVIHHNIIYNHSKMIVNFATPENFDGTRVISNLFLSAEDPEAAARDGLLLIEDLEKSHPDKWHSNCLGVNPYFRDRGPTKLIDRTYEQVDFSDPEYTFFEDDYRLEEKSSAWEIKAGAFLERVDLAHTDVDISSNKKIPPNYGKSIARRIFNSNLKPEVKYWFFANFNSRMVCLNSNFLRDGNDRICLKRPGKKQVSFAILNKGSDLLKVQTRLLSKDGNLEYPSVLGVAFDSDLDIKILKDIEIVDDTIQYTMDDNGVFVFILNYENKKPRR